jgi:signal transduction histidine kinase
VTLTLRARLAVIATTVSGLLLGGLSVVSYNVLARWLNDDVSTRLTELTEGLHGYLQFDGDVPRVEYNVNDTDQASFVNEATRFYRIYDAESGRLLYQSPDISPLGLSLTPSEIALLRSGTPPSDITTPHGRLKIVSSPVASPGGRPYVLQVGVSLNAMDTALSRYRDLLLLLTPLALLTTAVAAWWLAGFALAPLTRVAGAAADIDVTTLERRLPTRDVNDELEQVTRAFNDTLGRLEHSIGEMRQFSTALAHELRTPLAALRGEIELALRGSRDPGVQQTLGSQIEEIDRLTRLIEHVLTLARAESGQIPLSFGAVDLGALAVSLVDQLEPVANARSIQLLCESAPSVVARGDAGWLERFADQPARQRDQVHRRRRARGRARVARRRARAAGCRGYGNRHGAGSEHPCVRTVLSGRSVALLAIGWRRAGAQPGEVDHRSASRADHGRQPARPWLDLQRDTADDAQLIFPSHPAYLPARLYM